ncbi:C40 family peptidase [Fodinicola acaciae]|uniref:C40 family peptidase n=1 Tax=Fodinicola acaciae TaxID=2681555 RepID=UPI0013D2E4E3|nr:C40 family peptidase [Fodinicola acaciae]
MGSAEQLHDPVYASQQFYKALLRVPGWEQLPLTVAAQRVERSAYPNAYAKHEAIAARIVTAIATAICAAAGPFGQRVVEFASRWLGKAGYDWGAGDFHGPTGGNFDCSGLTLYAVYQASGGKIRLSHAASGQISFGTTVSRIQAAPGDLIFFHDRGDSSSYYHHVGVYLGQGMMIHAPDYGQLVEKSRVFGVKYWESQDIRFVRYGL